MIHPSQASFLCKGREFGHSIVNDNFILVYNRSEKVKYIYRDI